MCHFERLSWVQANHDPTTVPPETTQWQAADFPWLCIPVWVQCCWKTRLRCQAPPARLDLNLGCLWRQRGRRGSQTGLGWWWERSGRLKWEIVEFDFVNFYLPINIDHCKNRDICLIWACNIEQDFKISNLS